MSSPLDELEQRGAWATERHLPGATLPLIQLKPSMVAAACTSPHSLFN